MEDNRTGDNFKLVNVNGEDSESDRGILADVISDNGHVVIGNTLYYNKPSLGGKRKRRKAKKSRRKSRKGRKSRRKAAKKSRKTRRRRRRR